jgi:hypothetical protein
MRQILIEALPIVAEHDEKNSPYDEYELSGDLRSLIDLTQGTYRSLHFPSRTLADNKLPDSLSPQELWSACLDLVLHLNRGYGVTTNEMFKVEGAVDDLFKYGKAAHDPITKPYMPPKSFLYRVLAKVIGKENLKKFVNHNCDVYSPRWFRKDVLDD